MRGKYAQVGIHSLHNLDINFNLQRDLFCLLEMICKFVSNFSR